MKWGKGLCLLLGAILMVGSNFALSYAGQLEITLADNRKITTPYCWEENGEIKFPMPGGTAGVDKTNVVSIREVVSSGQVVISEMAKLTEKKEEKPEETIPGIIVPTRIKKKNPQAEIISHALTKQDPYAEEVKPLSSNELDMVENKCLLTKKEEIQKFFVASLQTAVEKNEIVRKIDNGYVIILRDVVTTPYENLNAKPILTLYDENGNVINEIPAQIINLKIPPEKALKYGLEENMKAVVSVFPLNCDVRRYEVSFVYNY